MVKIILIIITLITLSGCESSTQYGDCIGIADDKDSSLNYKLSTRNIVVGIIFFELIIPPVIVLKDETLCPVSFKK